MRKLVVALSLLLAGLAIFVLGFPYRVIYHPNSDPVYCVALTAVFLMAALARNIRIPIANPMQGAQDTQIVPRQAGRRGTASRTNAAVPGNTPRGSAHSTPAASAPARRSEGRKGLLLLNSAVRR